MKKLYITSSYADDWLNLKIKRVQCEKANYKKEMLFDDTPEGLQEARKALHDIKACLFKFRKDSWEWCDDEWLKLQPKITDA